MTIPNHAVYPGHPLTIATFILQKYGNAFERASEATYDERGGYLCPRALADNDIPGAGGCVYQALDLLKMVRDGVLSTGEAIEVADDMWIRRGLSGDHEKNMDAGLREARKICEDFLRLSVGFRAHRPEVTGGIPDGGMRVISMVATQGGRVIPFEAEGAHGLRGPHDDGGVRQLRPEWWVHRLRRTRPLRHGDSHHRR